jgi:cytosine/adenosine deaminase-related metal-dependent hydrolase
MLADSKLSGVWFREYLGNIEKAVDGIDSERGRFLKALAAHAPHTVGPDGLVKLKRGTRAQKRAFSIHLAESEAEMYFLQSGEGEWADYLRERGIDFSTWGLPVDGPVAYLDRLGLLDAKTIAVHLTYAEDADLELLAKRGVRVCLCPRSNQNLHGKIANLPRMLQLGMKPCLGTDSLASVSSLSMIDEMKFTAESFPSTPSVEILAMATVNGAKALGLSAEYGTVVPGKRAALLYVPIDVSKRSMAADALVNADFREECKLLV